jgi:alpha-D-xyloside xylohydrolase
MRTQSAALLAILAATALAGAAHGAQPPSSPNGIALTAAKKAEFDSSGFLLPVAGGYLKLEAYTDSTIRVAFSTDRNFFRHSSFSVISKPQNLPLSYSYGAHTIDLSTRRVTASVDLGADRVTFLDHAGHVILSEDPNGRTIEPALVQGQNTYHVRQEWLPNIDESLYGLGQQQLGLIDIKGYDLDLWQHNGTVAIPLLVSSRGYGIFWDNPSYTRFGDLRQASGIPADELLGIDGTPGGLSVSYFGAADKTQLISSGTDGFLDVEPPARRTFGVARAAAAPTTQIPDGTATVEWQGFVAPKETGDHIFSAFSNGDIKLWIDNRLVMNHWRQGWLPWWEVAKVHMIAGSRYAIRLEWDRSDGGSTIKLLWKTPAPSADTSLWSQVGDGIDYYFVYGPKIDQVISGYRTLTGTAPMMPQWAFGLWQSRQRYMTQQESLAVVGGFRSRQIPFDNIVQDWFYWTEDQWGSHQFDPDRFPDPDGWIKAIHAQHAHLMISVWPKFYTGTANFNAMNSAGYLYQPNLAEGLRDWVGYPYTFYDAFNPAARKLYWDQIDTALFAKGVDAWWMDASEPDLLPTPTLDGTLSHMTPTDLGPASRVLNAYPLENSKAIYEGQRAAAPNQRVFILTRSAYAGMQRYAASTWSGDTSSTWTAMRKQITAGLGFSLSGMPYWTMDTGGFSVPARYSRPDATDADIDDWRELNARWFEFGAFAPLLRVHGESPDREMWQFGGDGSPTYNAELKFDRLRYRLLPYIYSLAGAVTQGSGTIMRALVMDFQDDSRAREIGDEYMFGPAFLVSPVTRYQQRDRDVYLPKAAAWYDFWTGAKLAGGQTIDAPAPYDAIPLDIRAGSIVPFGPEQQNVGEKPVNPITLYVYTGANGSFTLYEDDGLTYDYEHGGYAQIPITWNDTSHMLTFGARVGSYSGMLRNRTFDIVIVSRDHPVGFSFTPRIDKAVSYYGTAVSIVLSLADHGNHHNSGKMQHD